MATFALLQVLMVALTSDWYSMLSGNPAVNMTRVLRPGTEDNPLARPRIAPRTLLTPKSASARTSDGAAVGGTPRDATIADGSPLGETADPFAPFTTCFRRAASAVKFCEMRTVPPNSAIAIKRSGPALASINLAAASRALI